MDGVWDFLLVHSPYVVGVIVLLPIAAFLLQYLIGRCVPQQSHWISILAIGAGWVLATALLVAVADHHDPLYRQEWIFTWFTAMSTPIRAGILVDNLTAGMLFTVTFIALMVHIYSVGYMHGDGLYWKFFAYLSFFSFSMLGLVASNNTFSLYCFWELVGVSSYLLIGFWFHKPSAADACLKAFITNRVGDVGFFMGLVLLYTRLGAFRYAEIFTAIGTRYGHGEIPIRMLTVAGVLIFCGAIGKSAQFPLHVWLPDAMEGPTPVSALIHAATMVAAGVYMVARLYPIFTPTAFLVIAYIGLITAVMAGLIAVAQNDIKRVLAYSTVSQLGYMVTALGVGGYTAGMFHLSTHAFFKALLFLCSGSVIHAIHTQDMREMGGLRHRMPITFATMLIATLAICGVPCFAGFYSKDQIFAAALTFGVAKHAHLGIFVLALIAAGVTAYYSFRLIFMTFFGAPRDPAKYHHAHESPATMAIPLCILAFFAVTAGYGKVGTWLGGMTWEQTTLGRLAAWGSWYPELVRPPYMPILNVLKTHGYTWAGQDNEGIAAAMIKPAQTEGLTTQSPGGTAANDGALPATPPPEGQTGEAMEGGQPRGGAEGSGAPEWIDGVAKWLSIVVVLVGIALAYAVYIAGTMSIAILKAAIPPLGRALEWLYPVFENKFYIDEIYAATWIAYTLALTHICAWFDGAVIDGIVNFCATAVRVTAQISGQIDLHIVDGAVNGVADISQWVGRKLRTYQDGQVQHYLVYSFAIVVALLVSIKMSVP